MRSIVSIACTGDYGSMVNERVGAGNWESGDELGDTWASRNSYSYGRCASPAALPAPWMMVMFLSHEGSC